MQYCVFAWWGPSALGWLHVVCKAPHARAHLTLKLFRQRAGGRQTLVREAQVNGDVVLAWHVDAGLRYRLYGYCSLGGGLPYQLLNIPGDWAWPVPERPRAATGAYGAPDAEFSELHVMFRQQRITAGQVVEQLHAGEVLKPVFASCALARGLAAMPVLRRFKQLYRLAGASGSQRLRELAVQLGGRADVLYCSHGPDSQGWHAREIASLLLAAQPGRFLVAPWRTGPPQSRLLLDCLHGCAEVGATVLYSASGAFELGTHPSAVGVIRVGSVWLLQQWAERLNLALVHWASAGIIWPPQALAFWLGAHTDEQGLARLAALLERECANVAAMPK